MEVIISGLIGSIIGYITNWLAIKMLFRPHKSKKIFGIKIPFTPGVIPKEKSRIAKSIGKSIGDYILTKETLVESLKSKKIIDQIKKIIKLKIQGIKNSEDTLKVKIKTLVGEKYNNIIGDLQNKISNYFLKNIQKEEFIKKISYDILDLSKRYFKVDVNKLLYNDNINLVKKNVLHKLSKYLKSENFNKEIQKIINIKFLSIEKSDKMIIDIIPESIISNLKIYIEKNKYNISMEIKEFFRDEKVEYKLKNIISNIIGSNLNPMIAMFINSDIIYGKLIDGINLELDKEENQQDIVIIINNILDKVLQIKLSDIILELPEKEKAQIIEEGSSLIINEILTEKLIKNLFLILEDKLNNNYSLEEVLLKIDEDFYNNLEKYIHIGINKLVKSENIHVKIRNYICNFVNKFMEIKIKDLFNQKEDQITDKVLQISEEIFNRFIETEGIKLLGTLNISNIIEDKINFFDIAFVEEMILEISRKELSAITWLGAFLGGTIGLLVPVLNSINM